MGRNHDGSSPDMEGADVEGIEVDRRCERRGYRNYGRSCADVAWCSQAASTGDNALACQKALYVLQRLSNKAKPSR